MVWADVLLWLRYSYLEVREARVEKHIEFPQE